MEKCKKINKNSSLKIYLATNSITYLPKDIYFF